jgi:hypothetical protein
MDEITDDGKRGAQLGREISGCKINHSGEKRKTQLRMDIFQELASLGKWERSGIRQGRRMGARALESGLAGEECDVAECQVLERDPRIEPEAVLGHLIKRRPDHSQAKTE